MDPCPLIALDGARASSQPNNASESLSPARGEAPAPDTPDGDAQQALRAGSGELETALLVIDLQADFLPG
jgi:hypothetical protein